uniref:Uncharacterized protein n=1 Tax=viral metagenome TaxID=1070528 RepID=A0A6C0DN38_9ZZZZ
MAEKPTTYAEFVSQILRPTNLESLAETHPNYRIRIFRSPSSPDPTEELILDDFFPFYTIEDLSTWIYAKMDQKEEYHPYNQCLLIPVGKEYVNLRYKISKSNLQNPFLRVQTPVTMDESNRTFYPQNQILLESAPLIGPIIDLYLYTDVYAAYPGIRPISPMNWNGIFRLYFPQHDKDYEDGSIPKDLLDYAPTLVNQFLRRHEVVKKLNEVLESGEPLKRPGESETVDPVHLVNLRHIRLTWDPLPPKLVPYKYTFSLDSFFFDFEVSPKIPYIRFFPKIGEPLHKIHIKSNVLPEPSMSHPDLLLKWAKEPSIRPNEDSLMIKALLRPESSGVFPIYVTLYVFEKGDAQLIVQPNEGVKNLSIHDMGDMTELLEFLQNQSPVLLPKSRFSTLPPLQCFTPDRCKIQDAYMILNLWFDKQDTDRLTKESIRTKLPFFRPFFQVTSSPLAEQNPLAYLRYKSVNNFVTPSRSAAFLRRVMELQRIAGTASLAQLVNLYQQEFHVPTREAEKRVQDFYQTIADYTPIQTISQDISTPFTQTENPGIDIAIFGKFPYYYFHIYRIDSLHALRRIKTLLSLFVSVSTSSLKEVLRALPILQQEEEEDMEDALIAEEVVQESIQESVQEPSSFEGLDTLGNSFFGFNAEADESLKTLLRQDPVGSTVPSKKLQDSIKEGAEAEAENDDAEDDISDASQLKTQKASVYFRKRLQYYDSRLFSYTKTHPSLKKYPSMCAGNALKQPAVVSEIEYEKMKQIYEIDETTPRDYTPAKVYWKEYPLQSSSPLTIPEDAEVITTLRYGSNLAHGQSNVFLCSRFWCRQDEIVVLLKDFQATRDRDGKLKPANTCPFCRGGLVKNRHTVVKGETVIERTVKDKSTENKRHTFIRFMKKTPHPQGLYLPCCFIKDEPIYASHPAFAPLKSRAQKRVQPELEVPDSIEEDAEQQEEQPEETNTSARFANYRSLFNRLHTTYILASNKLPLEVEKDPQVGLVPEVVDRYFQQTKENLVEKKGTMMNLHESAKGFLRVAVENRKRFQAESFLAAIAPYYGLSSSQEMKATIEVVLRQPNLFVALNYGNFLFEFYDPNDPTPTNNTLALFTASKFQGDVGTGVHREALVRLVKSYEAFQRQWKDDTAVKEYRQYAHLLSLPKMIVWKDFDTVTNHANGVVFIVLEVLKDGTLEVRCPPYGVSPTVAKRADIAFLLHYSSGIWEPLLYTRNSPSSEFGYETHEVTMIFSRSTYAAWPAIVKERVKEFETLCKTTGLGLYTDVPGVSNTSLIRLSQTTLLSKQVTPYSILRDTFNHVSAVTYKYKESLVVVPVIDDGSIYTGLIVHLDWRNFGKYLATPEIVEEFYATILDPFLQKYQSSMDRQMMYQRRSPDEGVYVVFSNSVMLKLKSGILIPVKATPQGSETKVDLLPWVLDTQVFYGTETKPSEQMTLSTDEFEELYQHLRISFSNWYALTATPTLKREIEDILFKEGYPRSDLSVMEKRQRLFIKLGSEVLGWMDSSIPLRGRKQSLKRMDCRVQPKEQCSSLCIWKESTSSCAIHTPATVDLGQMEVDARRLLVRKLIEELIQFPIKREELLRQHVPKYIPLTSAFRDGSQYIVRQDLPEWSEFLRSTWSSESRERPKFAEEFLSTPQPK